MARRRKRTRKTQSVVRCQRCRELRHDGERFYHGLCDSCRAERAAVRRSNTGARLLDKAKDGGTIDRDGQTFHVTVLPAKRRTGRRIR
jgi:hypothetical protein